MASITSANAVITMSISSLFSIPQQLQGFAADEIFGTDVLETAETMMGVDGLMSAGFVYVAIKQNYALQADSPSNAIFDQWYVAQQQVKDLYYASGLILLPALRVKWTMNKGVLTSYPFLPDAKKVLQPRKFGITWQSAVAANF